MKKRIFFSFNSLTRATPASLQGVGLFIISSDMFSYLGMLAIQSDQSLLKGKAVHREAKIYVNMAFLLNDDLI